MSKGTRVTYRRQTHDSFLVRVRDEDGNVVPLTGATGIKLWVWPQVDSPDTDGESVDLTASTTHDLDCGVIGVEIAPGDLTFTAGPRWWSVEYTLAGKVRRYPEGLGVFTITGGPTT